MKLINQTQNKIIVNELCEAKTFYQKTIGLIGTKSLSSNHGLLIKSCNWIHTFFMGIAIDVVYVDKNFIVKKIDSNIKPWRLPAPVFGASSVIELAANTSSSINLGDQLYVGD